MKQLLRSLPCWDARRYRSLPSTKSKLRYHRLGYLMSNISKKCKLAFLLLLRVFPERVAVQWLHKGSIWADSNHANNLYSVLIDVLDMFVWPHAPSSSRKKKSWLHCFPASTILRPSTAEAAEFSWCCFWGQRTVWLDPGILSLVRYLSRTRCDG